MSVTAGPYVLVPVNDSKDFVNTAGRLIVIDIESRTLLATIQLGGQPASIAVSPDGKYAAIAIENERNQQIQDGFPPQLPAGFMVSIDLDGSPSSWTPTIIKFEKLQWHTIPGRSRTSSCVHQSRQHCRCHPSREQCHCLGRLGVPNASCASYLPVTSLSMALT
jgi:hypothetical protein